MKFVYSFLIICICTSSCMFSQQISIDDSVGLQQLIEDNFVQGCVEISNISSSINGSSYGFPSYGYFNRGGSNFPFQDGIILTTGGAESAGNNVISPTLNEGTDIWGSDPDLDAALGNNNYLNATSIEFDLISISNQIQFNYLFASEDYAGINPCSISDGFVFLIKETASTAPYQNIALVPGTGTEVNTTTIRPNLLPACTPQNEQYFDGYNIGDTNYEGRTTALTASTTIVPYVQYHIKLIIADQIDKDYDSAVFIEGNSFQILDLGDDVETCESLVTLDGDIQNPLASYEWFLDNTIIPGETDPTLDAIQSGTYKVEITVPLNNTNCTEEDDIVVTLNSEEPITPIMDFLLCDDISGDGIETFDLSTKNAELIANIPFANYTFSYHSSDADARNNVNNITIPISNTISPQPIYVRIDDLNSNCFSYTSFNLIVNDVPNIVTPTPLEVCDSDDTPDGFTVIDLTQKDNEITSGQNDLIVSYHYNPIDANSGNNTIPNLYVNTTTPTDTIYVRVINTVTGCVNTTTLTVNITTSPIVTRDTQYLDACDSDLDGSANFDLTQVINNILSGLAGVTTTFHISYDDADMGINEITNPANYQYDNANPEPGSATIYVRVQDDNTECASIVPLEIHTNLLLTGTDTGDFALCDINDDENDTLDFNLNTVEGYINNDLPNPIIVTFFESQDDLDNNVGAIDKSVLYSAISPTVLYIRLEDTVSGCIEESEITLLVNPILLFDSLTPLPYCDDDDDGIVSIDLHSLDNTITGGNPDFTVTYFSDPTDAQNNIGQLPPFYTNTNPIEPVYARIESIRSGCSTINPFEIEVILAPAANQPTPFIICDDDQDGFSIIDLDTKIDEIVADRTGLNFDFFTSPSDASNFTSPIIDIATYNANTQTIYVRVESSINLSGCYNIVELEIIVNTLPIIPTISNFQICQTGGTTADFLLADKDAEILNGQIGKEVFYFEDAAYTIPIDKNSIYQNRSSPETIHVRVENITDANCFDISSFILQVSPDPVYNDPTPFLVCDDITNDEIEIFDLNEKILEISQGSPDVLNVTFHFTEQHALDNVNPLPIQYSNIENPQTIYARIESDDSLCYVIEEIGINIIAAPDITEAQLLEACDTDYDGYIEFNLESADFEINDRIQTDLVVNYFENFEDINQDDGLDNSLAILDPINFISNSQTVYIKVANMLTGCFSVIPLELIVNVPPATNNIGTIEICDNNTDIYDLSLVDSMIVDDTSIVTISYHSSPTDATNNTGALANLYNYTLSLHTIFIRVSDIVTGCPIIVSFDLQINQNPIANTPPDIVDCDDDYDGILQVDLTQNNGIILDAQNPLDYSIYFYNTSIDDAENDTTRLNNIHSAIDGETIYVRLENNDTECYATAQFNIRINPLPIIPLNTIVPICNDEPTVVNADTGVIGDTYLWSTGETTNEILVLPANVGDYSVRVTRPNIIGNDCSYTHNFTITPSDEAIIDFTPTVDFADPNSITVEIDPSKIGDYVYILDEDEGGQPQTSNVFDNVTFGEHTVTVRDLNGCMDVIKEVFVFDIPKFITPNNDSAYDTWHIIGANRLPGTVVYIYNRYGKLLKTLPHNSSGWDGTYNGQNMPSDDYWFSADIIQNGESFNIRGHFALKR